MSQFGEDKVLQAYFEEKGITKGSLVDVGAYAKEFSNTWSLLNEGWSGVLVDATPMNIKTILDDFKGLDVKVVCAAIAGENCKMIPLHLHDHTGHNSLLDDWHPVNKTGQEVWFPSVTLPYLLRDMDGMKFDFELLSIDTEGMDYAILEEMFTTAFLPRVVVTERISHQKSDDLFMKNGYEFMGITGPEDNPYGNGFYTRIGMPSDELYKKTELRMI